MPIKPENRGRYPSNWGQIRMEILDRASHRCEKCGVANRSKIHRGLGAFSGLFRDEDGIIRCAETGEPVHHPDGGLGESRVTEIVLTIAHLDHQPENCAPENLRAWCQRCHLRYDKDHHAETRKRPTEAIGDTARVVRLRTPESRGCKSIQRGTKYGNPFEENVHGTREEVICLFEIWLMGQPELVAQAKRELRGFNLGCHCAPKPCHGDVWLKLVNQEATP